MQSLVSRCSGSGANKFALAQRERSQEGLGDPPKVLKILLATDASVLQNIDCLAQLGFCDHIDRGIRVATPVPHADHSAIEHSPGPLPLPAFIILRHCRARAGFIASFSRTLLDIPR